jgi:putative zinc finger/helix-turn-helix YgiT family protein
MSNAREGGIVNYRCSNCEATARKVRTNYPFKESGLSNVVLKGIETIQCDRCGNADPIIPRANEVMKQLVLAVVEKPHPLTGQEVRFLRKYLGMSGATFASHLGVDRAALSRWENGHDRIGTQSDRLIRMVATSLGGLKNQVEQVARKISMIDNDPKTLMIEINVEELSFQYA